MAQQAPSPTEDMHGACSQLATILAGGTPNLKTGSVLTLQASLSQVTTIDLQQRLSAVLRPTFRDSAGGSVRVVYFLCSVAEQLRQSTGNSIKSLVRSLAASEVLVDETLNKESIRWVFASIGWMTLLYQPNLDPTCGPLTIETGGSSSILVSSLDDKFAHRSVGEILNNFGDILPTRRIACGNDALHTQILQVANLNIATLIRVARIQVEWVDEISSHLIFEASTLKLQLLRLPSLCYLHMTDQSVLSSVFEGYYEKTQKPDRFNSANYMREIIQSYSLLFLFDTNAQKMYRNSERKRANRGEFIDPLLDSLCLSRESHLFLSWLYWFKTPVKESFDSSSDFPILSDRLISLQDYVESIRPNKISSLWRDKRDILRWYTFWAVIILGGLNLIVATLQAALSAAQVRLARESLNLQPHRT